MCVSVCCCMWCEWCWLGWWNCSQFSVFILNVKLVVFKQIDDWRERDSIHHSINETKARIIFILFGKRNYLGENMDHVSIMLFSFQKFRKIQLLLDCLVYIRVRVFKILALFTFFFHYFRRKKKTFASSVLLFNLVSQNGKTLSLKILIFFVRVHFCFDRIIEICFDIFCSVTCFGANIFFSFVVIFYVSRALCIMYALWPIL